MRRFLLALLALALGALPAPAAQPLSHITGPIMMPSGSRPGSVQLTITPSTSFTVNDTVLGAAKKWSMTGNSFTINVSDSSACHFYLTPNTGSGNVPDGTYYSVKVSANGTTYQQTWQIGTSGSDLIVGDVIIPAATTPTVTYVPAAGGTFTGLTTHAVGLRLYPMASAPASPLAGQLYFKTSDNTVYYYNGSSFVPLGSNLSVVSHDGTLTGDGTSGSPLGVIVGALAHNSLSGLTTGDPHTQYVLAAGTRAFSGNQSFGGFQALNLRIENLATGSLPSPGSGTKGRMVFDSTANLMYWDNGTALVNPLARANHSGTQLKSTISDFAHASTHNTGGSDAIDTYYLLLSGGTMSGSLNMGGNTVTNFRADPQGSDPATTAGRIWFNTGSNLLKWGNGSAVINPLDRANHTGALTANLDFANFQALSFRLENLASNPAAGQAGRLIYNTVTQKLQLDTGASVGDIGVSASVVTASPLTGNGLSSSPVDLDESAVTHNNLGGLTTGNPHTQYVLKDGTTALTGNWASGGFEIQNFLIENVATGSLATPSSGNEGRFSFDDTLKLMTFSNGTTRTYLTPTPTAYAVPIADPATAKLDVGWLPTSTASVATAVVRADDARLSDARTPATHAASHKPGGGDSLDVADGFLAKAGGGMSGNIDMNENQLLEARLENLSSNPAAGNAGRVIYNSVLGKIQIDNGSTFGDLLGASSIVFAESSATAGSAGTLDAAGYHFDLTVTGGVAKMFLATDSVTATALGATGVTPGSSGSSTAIPVITVDADGRLTAVSTATPAVTVKESGASAGTAHTFDFWGGHFDVSLASNIATFFFATNSVTASSLAASGVSAGSYGSASEIPVITFDEDGRATSASTAAITPGVSVNTTGTAYNVATIELLPTGNVSTSTALIGTTLRITLTAPEDNLLINPEFALAQRGTSFPTMTSGSYGLDRWVYLASGAMVHTVSQSTTIPTVAQANRLYAYSMLTDCTTVDASIAAGDYCLVGQRVEGFRWAEAAQKDFNLSFWVRGTKTGIHCVGFRNGAGDRSYVAEYTIFSADTWEWTCIPVPASPSAGNWNYTNSIGIQVTWALACGSTYQTTANAWQMGNYFGTANQVNATDSTSNDFRITGALLVPGTHPPMFRARPYGTESLLCKRYFQRLGGTGQMSIVMGMAYAINQALCQWDFEVDMRTTPTLTTNDTSGFYAFRANAQCNGVSFPNASARSTRVDFAFPNTITAGEGIAVYNNPNTAYLQADAEL